MIFYIFKVCLISYQIPVNNQIEKSPSGSIFVREKREGKENKIKRKIKKQKNIVKLLLQITIAPIVTIGDHLTK